MTPASAAASDSAATSPLGVSSQNSSSVTSIGPIDSCAVVQPPHRIASHRCRFVVGSIVIAIVETEIVARTRLVGYPELAATATTIRPGVAPAARECAQGPTPLSSALASATL